MGVLREQEDVWKEAESVARARYAVGQGAQQDVLRAQVEITRFEQLRAEQEAEVESRLAELSRLVGREVQPDSVRGVHLALRPEPRDLAALQAQAEATLPELRAGAAVVERERLASELAQRDFKPDFAVQAGYMNRGGLDPMWQAGVGVTLPLYRGRRHAAVAEAEAGRRRGRPPAGGGPGADPLPHARARRPAPRRRADGRRLRRRPSPAGADVLRGLDRQLPGRARCRSSPCSRPSQTLHRDRVDHLRVLAAHEEIKASIAEASLEATSAMPSGGGSGMGSLAGSFGGAGESGGRGLGTGRRAGSAAMSGPMGN